MEIPVVVAVLAAALYFAFPTDQLCPEDLITMTRRKRATMKKENFTYTIKVLF
jgi:hypothetical protein